MNIYGIIILSALLSDYLLNLYADILNLKNLKPELPEEFRDVFDKQEYAKSQHYTKVKTKFGIFTSTFNLVLILIFWFSGGFNFLDNILRSWNLHPILTGLLYIGILILIKTILSIPFSVYSTFVIEEKFDFNKTTPKVFIADLMKGFALALIIGAPLLAGVLAFFRYAGNMAWVYCWIITVFFTILLQYIAPRWILPLFNKFEPLEDGELKERIFKYANSVEYKLSGIFVMNGSKRSTKSNAFFTGFGKNRRVVLFDTLIEKHTIPEMITILAHEIGHYKKKHILQSMLISIVHTGVLFYLLSIFISHKGLFDAFYMDHMSIYCGLIFFGMLYTPVELILSILMNILSRKNEYTADRFAAETTNDPMSMIKALKKLSVDNLVNLLPHKVYVFLNYSHPPILKRIRSLKHSVNT